MSEEMMLMTKFLMDYYKLLEMHPGRTRQFYETLVRIKKSVNPELNDYMFLTVHFVEELSEVMELVDNRQDPVLELADLYGVYNLLRIREKSSYKHFTLVEQNTTPQYYRMIKSMTKAFRFWDDEFVMLDRSLDVINFNWPRMLALTNWNTSLNDTFLKVQMLSCLKFVYRIYQHMKSDQYLQDYKSIVSGVHTMYKPRMRKKTYEATIQLFDNYLKYRRFNFE